MASKCVPVLLVVFLAGGFYGKARAQQSGAGQLQNVIASLNVNGYLIMEALFSNASIAGDLDLADGSNKTIFVPSDAALTAAGVTDPTSISSDSLASLLDTLSYHIVPAYLPSTALLSALNASQNATTFPTRLGSDYLISVTQDASGIYVNERPVIQTDIVQSGVVAVHAINGVLVPPAIPNGPVNGTEELNSVVAALNATGNYSTLLQVLGTGDILSRLNLSDGSNRTIFAPTDEAFAAAAAIINPRLNDSSFIVALLQYHIAPAYFPAASVLALLVESPQVIPTTLTNENLTVSLNITGVYVNGNEVVETDIVTSGVTAVHGIGGVLVLSQLQEVLAALRAANYSTLAGLLPAYAAELGIGDGNNRTLFAPSDEAFASAPSGALADVTNVLQYHAVPAYLPAAAILTALPASPSLTSLPTVQGGALNVTRNSSGLYANSVLVEATDVTLTGSTAVHGISGVLIPPDNGTASSSPPPPPPSPPPPGAAAHLHASLLFSAMAVLLSLAAAIGGGLVVV